MSQELPPIKNFLPKEYHGENQNWAISQSGDKIIYVANSKGLLAFNGASWKLYPSPNETIMRSVHVIDGRIYTGCFMEFGYWQKNNLGILDYTSLSQRANIDLVEDEEFWNIISLDNYLVFQSLRRIYIYNADNGHINTIDSDNTITKMFMVNQSIYFQRMGEGIFKVEDGKDILIFDDAVVKDDEVINIFQNKNELLVLTQNNGFYSSSDDSLVKSKFSSNEFLSSLSFYDGIRLKDQSFVLGTISKGLIYLDEYGELIYRIDQNNGLLDNTVLAIFEDAEKNIWLGLDNGISYLNTNVPYRVFKDNKGVVGSVYASKVHNGDLYLGTNQGLYYKDLKGENAYSFIEGTQGQVWSLKEIDGTLFCGHHSGTFIVNGYKANKIANIQGTWDIASINSDYNRLLQGNYDGLYVLEKSNNSWKLKNKIQGFNNSSRYFETLGNKIFVNHEYNGVFQIKVDSSFTQVENVAIDTLIKGSNSGIIKYKGDLLYSYKKGIFKYNAITQEFVKESLLSNAYSEDEYESGKMIIDEKDNILWVFTNSNISFVSPSGVSNEPTIKSIPLTKEMRYGILGYENITRLNDDGIYLVGTTSGYITININALINEDFEVHIGEVINGSIEKHGGFLDKTLNGSFNNDQNNIEISFYTPEFNKFLITNYQFQLKGIYDKWSAWSENSTSSFENLPYGDYTFNVRAKIGNTISKNIASYSFNVKKPWYISNVMLATYLLGLLMFYLIIHNMYKRHYRIQREKLITKKEREFKLSQVQNEKEIIRIKNEQLKLEFKNKSKELAASTMSIVKKNELLTTIKKELNAIKKDAPVKPIINIIDKNLNRNDDWEFFQEAFNNADSGFLQKMKNLHPNLTPNDLRLCAYLRLNLSSKEIAPLLNISARSVEVKRYRLRKKMALLHEKSLTDYILNL
ncbi:MAG: LuxR family transcriptional regulator [Eudoraea sp.]|nr:LuxR family transcriptional regulator [Eudoraea sp.]